MKKLILLILLLSGCTRVLTPTPAPSELSTPSPSVKVTPNRLIAFTLDDARESAPLMKGFPVIKNLAMRVVFDEGESADDYRETLKLLKPYGLIVGELLDSSAVEECSQSCYESRAKEYLKLYPLYDILEVGNELNGDWVGANADKKLIATVRLVGAAGVPMLLTLYMDEQESWKAWAAKLPPDTRAALKYVFMSHYPGDNDGFEPDWEATAKLMGELFPNALLGLGEMGVAESQFKSSSFGLRMVQAAKYWALPVSHPRWIGFGGYWYGTQELKKNKDGFVNALKASSVP